MAMIRRAMTAEDSDGRYEFQGRFLAHVGQLERMLRYMIACHLAEADERHPRFRLIYTSVIQQLNFDRLTQALDNVVALSEGPVDPYRWVPRDLRRLVKIRNEIAHPRAPWDSRQAPQAWTQEEAIRLLYKVDSGLARLGIRLEPIASLNTWEPWPDDRPSAEQECTAHADHCWQADHANPDAEVNPLDGV